MALVLLWQALPFSDFLVALEFFKPWLTCWHVSGPSFVVSALHFSTRLPCFKISQLPKIISRHFRPARPGQCQAIRNHRRFCGFVKLGYGNFRVSSPEQASYDLLSSCLSRTVACELWILVSGIHQLGLWDYLEPSNGFPKPQI